MKATLKESLKDWQEIDVALCALAEHLGLVETDSFLEYKPLYWSCSGPADMLGEMFFKMVDKGIIERRDYKLEDQVRWNPDYDLNHELGR